MKGGSRRSMSALPQSINIPLLSSRRYSNVPEAKQEIAPEGLQPVEDDGGQPGFLDRLPVSVVLRPDFKKIPFLLERGLWNGLASLDVGRLTKGSKNMSDTSTSTGVVEQPNEHSTAVGPGGGIQ